MELWSGDARTLDWAYDDLYRLTKETIKEDGDTKQITEYDYDDVGNRLAKTLIEGTNRYDTTYAYDNMDRLMTESTTTTVLADAVAGPDEFWLAANPRRAGYYAFIGFCALALSAALAPLGWLGLRRRVARVRVLPAPWGKRETRRRAKNGSIALLLSTLMIVGPEQVYALGNDAAAVHAITTAAIGTVPPSSIDYTYDANGNMITKAVDGATPTKYAYDAENRLVSIDPQTIAADIVTYAYDDDGIRKSKTVGDSTTFYLTDKNRPYAQVLEERDETGALLVRYTYGLDLIAQTRPGTPDPVTRYYHYDGQMSTRLLSDENATPVVTDTYNYEAFGEQLNGAPGSTTNNYLYTGEQIDPNAGLHYLRSRYYDHHVGRFTSRDRINGIAEDPMSLHKYLYANANPIMHLDPNGFCAASVFGTRATRVIGGMYRVGHPGQDVRIDRRITGFVLNLRPDIANYTVHEAAEIKPSTPYGIAKGHVDLTKYIFFLGVATGALWSRSQWDPGIVPFIVPLCTRHFGVTLTNAGGVIYYVRLKNPYRTIRELLQKMNQMVTRFLDSTASALLAAGVGIQLLGEHISLAWRRASAVVYANRKGAQVAFALSAIGLSLYALVSFRAIALRVPV